jgi:DNA-binding transcriptional ArsR family regulator
MQTNVYLHYRASTRYNESMQIKHDKDIAQQLANSELVRQCAMRHNTVGDMSSMKVCYLLHHYPNLSVGEIAELIGLSVSATSRCLTKLKMADVVESSKQAQTVRYSLLNNSFTNNLISQLDTNLKSARGDFI